MLHLFWLQDLHLNLFQHVSLLAFNPSFLFLKMKFPFSLIVRQELSIAPHLSVSPPHFLIHYAIMLTLCQPIAFIFNTYSVCDTSWDHIIHTSMRWVHVLHPSMLWVHVFHPSELWVHVFYPRMLWVHAFHPRMRWVHAFQAETVLMLLVQEIWAETINCVSGLRMEMSGG